MYAQKFYDVQKYVSTTGHAYDALVLMASKKFWDGLSPADRELLQAAGNEATLFQRQTSRELNGNAARRTRQAGNGDQRRVATPSVCGCARS